MPIVWIPQLYDHLNQMLDDGASVEEWTEEATYFRFFCMTQDRRAAGDFVTALHSAGVTALVHTVGEGGAIEESLPNIAARQHTCRVFHKHMFQAGSAEEIRLAKTQNRMAVIFSLNGPPGDTFKPTDAARWLRVSCHPGVRFLHLAYDRRNHMAGSCTEEQDEGLSDYGRDYATSSR